MAMTADLLSADTALAARDEKTLSPARGVTMATPGLVRTVVPAIVGAALSFAATHNITVPAEWESEISFALTGLLTGVYWLVADALQSRWPLAGLLLGSTAKPTYTGRHRKTSADPATATSDTPPDDRQ